MADRSVFARPPYRGNLGLLGILQHCRGSVGLQCHARHREEEPRSVTDAIPPGVKEANAKVGCHRKKREVTRERLRDALVSTYAYH
jgi:hypothetical protein